jgi:hypothetical protein
VNVAVGGCVSSTKSRRRLCLLQVVVPSTHRQGKGEVLVRCGKCHRCADDGVLDGSVFCCSCSCLSNTPGISGNWGSWEQLMFRNTILQHHTISKWPLARIACMFAHRLLRVQLPPEMLEPTSQLPDPAAHVTPPPLAPNSRPGQLKYSPQVRSSCHRWWSPPPPPPPAPHHTTTSHANSSAATLLANLPIQGWSVCNVLAVALELEVKALRLHLSGKLR